MPEFQVNILDWAAWGPHIPGHPDIKSWQSPTVGSDGMASVPPAGGVGASYRRRLTEFGRNASEVAHNALKGRDAMVVFASRHGDIHRTVKLLEQVVGEGSVSPTDFSMSVHNAVAGILSISWKLTRPITSVAAGGDTLAAGFTEALAISLSHPDVPVLLVYVDVDLPGVYETFRADGESAFALAVLMQVGEPADSVVTRITCQPSTAPGSRKGVTKQAQDMAVFLSGLGHDFNFGTGRTGWALKRD